MASFGTLAFTSYVNGTLILGYTPGTSFDNGTIYLHRRDTGTLTTQAVASGANTFTSLPNGIRYTAWVTAFDSTPTLLGATTPVYMYLAGPYSANPQFTIEWRTDRQDWQSLNLETTINRHSIPVNVRGYWYQQRIKCTAQNQRLIFSDMKLHMRIHGRGEEVAANE